MLDLQQKSARTAQHSHDRPAARQNKANSTLIVKLTASELRLLTTLASDQLFRREFIDPKMPGHHANPEELRLAKKLIERLAKIGERAKGAPLSRAQGATA